MIYMEQLYNSITRCIISIFDYFDRHRIITERITNEPYLERYYLFLKDRQSFPCNIFLHKFLKSDPDDLHDHPWSYITIILYGGYWEHTLQGKFWRKPFHIYWNSSETLHRVELDPEIKHCWTLFIPLQKQREWGFLTEHGWIHNEKYLYNKKTS